MQTHYASDSPSPNNPNLHLVNDYNTYWILTVTVNADPNPNTNPYTRMQTRA